MARTRPGMPRIGVRSADLLGLQRVTGNRATQRWLAARRGVAPVTGVALRTLPAPGGAAIARTLLIQRDPVSAPQQSALNAAFGCSIPGCKYGDRAIAPVLASAATLATYVERDLGKLRALIGYVTGGAEAEMQPRIDNLIAYNTKAKKKLIGFGPIPAPPAPATLAGMLADVDNAPAPIKPKLVEYMEDVSFETFTTIAASQADLYEVGRVMGAGGNIMGRNVTPVMLPLLRTARAQHGPASGNVPPMATWGKGTEASPDANKEVHFRKHVLRLGNPANPDALEPLRWKRALNLTITRAFIGGHAPGGEEAVRAYFTADGGDFLNEDQANAFYNVYLADAANAAVVAALLVTFGNTYYAAVANVAQNLTRAVIGSDGTAVKLMGYGTIGSSDVFIAGRLTPAGGADAGLQGTISSGYITTEDQLTTRNIGSIAWKVRGA